MLFMLTDRQYRSCDGGAVTTAVKRGVVFFYDGLERQRPVPSRDGPCVRGVSSMLPVRQWRRQDFLSRGSKNSEVRVAVGPPTTPTKSLYLHDYHKCHKSTLGGPGPRTPAPAVSYIAYENSAYVRDMASYLRGVRGCCCQPR